MPHIHAALITGGFALVAAIVGAVVANRLALRRSESERRSTEPPQIVLISIRSRWWR
ncbi:hypothetical protein GA0115250_106629 [Streptomyces sp. BvitLS-983]|nr:hypothetical protein GA0115250_106629 [Streptomyces sp. BvitLS-983]